jgi:hypothetical protein
MTATFTNWARRVRFTSPAYTWSSSAAAYSATPWLAQGTEVAAGGGDFGDYTAFGPILAQGDIWEFNATGATADELRGDAPGASQFGSLIIEDVSIWQQPAVVLRGTFGGGLDNGWFVSPWIHLGGVEVAEFTAGVYTLMGAGGAHVDVVGDKLTATATDPANSAGGTTTIAAFYNDVAEFAFVSALHPAGEVGIAGTTWSTFPQGVFSNFLVGNLAILDNVEIEESDGFPIVLSAGQLSGSFQSEVIEGSGGACDWWSALVEVHEEEVGHLVGDADYEAGSGEARWRGVYTREATEAKPGADFDWLVGDATENVEDASLRVCGRKGMHGRNTRAKVWTRFRVSAVWGSWIEGAWVGNKAADAMQIKVELDRVSLDYQIRMTRVLLAVAT